MTRKRWLELYDALNIVTQNGDTESIIRWLRLLLIEFKPDQNVELPKDPWQKQSIDN